MASRDPQRPNVLFVLADDLGEWGLGCTGNTDARTPVLDGLAQAGILLENSFCTSPVCSPARASLLTGRIPSQHGVQDWLSGPMLGADSSDYLSGQLSVTDVLADHGYRCGLAGKWHLGASDRPRKGFVHWFSHQRGGGPYFNAPMVRNGEPVEQPGYLSDALADEAVDFLQAEADNEQPFWFSLHFTAPHSPWVDAHPQDLLELFADLPFDSVPQEPQHPWMMQHNGEVVEGSRNPLPSLRGYFAAVTGMDRAVGRVLEQLSSLGLDESTLVVFTSDNGMNCGHHGIWGKGNGTYPQNMYDSSIKVPLIFAQPGRIAAGGRSDVMISGYDMMPTVLEYLGVKWERPAGLPGRSFAGVLDDEGSADELDSVVVYDEYGPVRMIRTRDHKYVHRYPDGPHELYDLRADPGERSNLVDQPACAAERDQLRSRLESWFDTYVEPTRDGRDSPVSGLGQLAKIGTVPRGQEFVPLPADPDGSSSADRSGDEEAAAR